MYFPSPANIRLTGLFAFIYLLFQLTVGIFTECDMPKIKPLCSQRLRHRRHGRLLLLHFPYPGLHLLASNSAAAFCMIIVMLPFFLLAMYERHGQPLEVVAGQIIRCMFLRTKERPYQTNNFYAALERQAQAEKEVKAIVQKAKARAAGTTGGKSRGKADRRRKA
jgi:hypothetical protein